MKKKYSVIVVDPPWPMKKVTHRERPNQIEMDYKVMTIDEIKKLKIESIAKNKSWCFLWVPQKHLFSAREILEGWGFKYLLTMTWEKTYGRSSGMPLFGFRWNGEFILVGYKSKPEMWPKRKLIPAVFSAENIRHSQKPERFYKMIEVLGRKRIDIFARNKRIGWDVYGDEVKSDIKL